MGLLAFEEKLMPMWKERAHNYDFWESITHTLSFLSLLKSHKHVPMSLVNCLIFLLVCLFSFSCYFKVGSAKEFRVGFTYVIQFLCCGKQVNNTVWNPLHRRVRPSESRVFEMKNEIGVPKLRTLSTLSSFFLFFFPFQPAKVSNYFQADGFAGSPICLESESAEARINEEEEREYINSYIVEVATECWEKSW